MEKSLWQKDIKNTKYKTVEENKKTDILIIGAGLTGLSTGYNFINKNYNVIIIDSNKFLYGATSKSTGKITYLQELKYQDIQSVYDYDTAKLYYESQKDAIKMIKNIINKNDINCDLKKVNTITYTKDEKELKKFKDEKSILTKLGVKYYESSSDLVYHNIKDMIVVKDSYIFNPVKYMNGLLNAINKSKNIKVYENSLATKIEKEEGYYAVIVNEKKIYAKKVVLACHYPFITIPGFVPFKTYVEKSYLTATKVDETKKISCITSNYPTESFRYHEDEDKYFIFLNNSSKICDKLNYKKNYDQCINSSKKITGKNPGYKWTNMDVMTNDFIPLIGKISKDEDNIFIATGYNTWGMTNSVMAAKVIYDLITKNENKYQDLFDPARSMNITKFKNFTINTVLSNVKAYSFNLIRKNPTWYKNRALVTKINGKRVGIYFDNNGDKHIVSNICPHLKCFLTFNEVDKTWDCPCHGSRFDTYGNIVKSPSVHNIKIDDTIN